MRMNVFLNYKLVIIILVLVVHVLCSCMLLLLVHYHYHYQFYWYYGYHNEDAINICDILWQWACTALCIPPSAMSKVRWRSSLIHPLLDPVFRNLATSVDCSELIFGESLMAPSVYMIHFVCIPKST